MPPGLRVAQRWRKTRPWRLAPLRGRLAAGLARLGRGVDHAATRRALDVGGGVGRGTVGTGVGGRTRLTEVALMGQVEIEGVLRPQPHLLLRARWARSAPACTLYSGSPWPGADAIVGGGGQMQDQLTVRRPQRAAALSRPATIAFSNSARSLSRFCAGNRRSAILTRRHISASSCGVVGRWARTRSR